MVDSTGTGVYGFFYSWINTMAPTNPENIYYRHEAVYFMRLNGGKLQRLLFDKGKGANGDGSGGWNCHTTAYGGNHTTLESDAEWQAAYKSGLVIRIERTVVNGATDSYVISVTSKDGTEKLVSTAIEVTDDTFGAYNWILFGTQSIDATISNVEFGRK
jgi:hypothetical protein